MAGKLLVLFFGIPIALIVLLVAYTRLIGWMIAASRRRLDALRLQAGRSLDADEVGALCRRALAVRRWYRLVRWLEPFGHRDCPFDRATEWELFWMQSWALEQRGDAEGARRALVEGVSACRSPSGVLAPAGLALEWHLLLRHLHMGSTEAVGLAASIGEDFRRFAREEQASGDPSSSRFPLATLGQPWPEDPGGAEMLALLGRQLPVKLPERGVSRSEVLVAHAMALEEAALAHWLLLLERTEGESARWARSRARRARLMARQGRVALGNAMVLELFRARDALAPEAAREVEDAVIELWPELQVDAPKVLEDILVRRSAEGRTGVALLGVAAGLAVLHERRGDHEKAGSYLELALAADPGSLSETEDVFGRYRTLSGFLRGMGAERLAEHKDDDARRTAIQAASDALFLKMVPHGSGSVDDQLQSAAQLFDELLSSGDAAEARGLAALAQRRVAGHRRDAHTLHAEWALRLGLAYLAERETAAAGHAIRAAMAVLAQHPHPDPAFETEVLLAGARLDAGTDTGAWFDRLALKLRDPAASRPDQRVQGWILVAGRCAAAGDEAGARDVLDSALLEMSSAPAWDRLRLLAERYRRHGPDEPRADFLDRWTALFAEWAGDPGGTRGAAGALDGVLRMVEVLLAEGHGADALSLCGKIRSRLEGAAPPELVRLHLITGEIHEQGGRFEEALLAYSAALQATPRTAGDLHPRVVQAFEGSARSHRMSGRPEEARRLYEALCARAEDRLGDHSAMAKTYREAARSC